MNQGIYDKDLLLARVDFDRNKKPRLKLIEPETDRIYNFTPTFGEDITLEIATAQRFCIGWHDLTTGEEFACPERSEVEKKYEQCPRCQKRTGFNPAFYNAAEGDISAQQIERNQQPHFVYLAYFAENTIKVGISFAGRDIARLLEQGARAALILDEFPSANVARNYEAKISAMPSFCENVKSNAKIKLLEIKFDEVKARQLLNEARDLIESNLNIRFTQNEVMFLDKFYSNQTIPHGEIIDTTKLESANKITFSGKLLAQVGYILIAQQQDENLVIPARKFTGYKLKISNKITEVELPERQASLFDF